jgi:hypothetical protein
MIVTEEEKKRMSEERQKEYCEWCFFYDYGDCNKCALYVNTKRGGQQFKSRNKN